MRNPWHDENGKAMLVQDCSICNLLEIPCFESAVELH